jgi:hypothetical protein
MAGFVKLGDEEHEFHINPNSKSMAEIHKMFGFKRVVTIQVDGDELDAVLFGLAHYKKHPTDQLIRLKALFDSLSTTLTAMDLKNTENFEAKDFV